MPAEAVQPVAEVVGAADEDEPPGEAQVPEAALQLRALALLHRLRAVRQALLHIPHLGREALRAAAGSCVIASAERPGTSLIRSATCCAVHLLCLMACHTKPFLLAPHTFLNTGCVYCLVRAYNCTSKAFVQG